MGELGTVDPFDLRLVEEPPGSGQHFLAGPGDSRQRMALEAGGLSVAGAGQALLTLSLRWLGITGREEPPDEFPPVGEVRVVLRRREARLCASLLRGHLGRLPEPPGWMPELLQTLEHIDEFLRWEEV